MTIALFPGTFDPPTLGHVSAATFAVHHQISGSGKLVIVLGTNPDKKDGMFNKENRFGLFWLGLDDETKSHIIFEYGDKYNEKEIFTTYRFDKIIRGIRKYDDIDHEMHLAQHWRRVHGEVLAPDCRVVWQDSPPALIDVSGTAARDAILGQNGKDLNDLDWLMPETTGKLLQEVLTRHPEARKDLEILNAVVQQELNSRLPYHPGPISRTPSAIIARPG